MKTQILRIVLAVSLMASLRAADVPISGLPAISSVTSTTIVPVVDTSGTPATKKATVAQLVSGLPNATGGAAGLMSATDKAKLDAGTASNTASALVRRDASGNFAANVITAASVTGLSDPVLGTDAATKNYVDASAAGLIIKSPARAATTGSNITLAGGAPTTLDGVTLNTNDRVLVKDQTDAKENGIYFVATLGSGSNGTWSRTTDADTGAELVTGSYVFITGGTTNTQSAWTMVTQGTITIGTSLITWNLFSQTTQILASNIIGQIVASQVQDGAINTAKFALTLKPVEIFSSLPTTGNVAGRMVFLTTDSKLYRYDGSNFTAAVPAQDITSQITTTQISDNAISSPKISAGAVSAGKIAANAVTAGTIAANAITAGTIQAGAISTSELAAGAVNASKIAAGSITADRLVANSITAGQIAAGTITADRLNISSLSAISGNIGTITSGAITASASIAVGSGKTAVNISSSQFSIGDIAVTNYSGIGTQLSAKTGSHEATLYSTSSGAAVVVQNGAGPQILLFDTGEIRVNSGLITVSGGSSLVGPGSILSIPGNSDSINFVFGQYGSAGSQDGYIGIILNGVAKKIPFYSF